MTKYKLAIFDMDGTILNTLEDLADTLNYSLEKYGYPQRTLDEVKSFVGNGIYKLVERGVPEGTSKDSIDRVFAEFNNHYKDHCLDKTKPYEGINELLDKLRDEGIKLAVVSNKADYAVKDLCEKLFYGKFDAAVGAKDGIRKKPAPDSVNEVMLRLNINTQDCIYIGDSEVDIMTAKNAHIDECIVTWGYRDEEFLKSQGARSLASSTNDLLEYVL